MSGTRKQNPSPLSLEAVNAYAAHNYGDPPGGA